MRRWVPVFLVGVVVVSTAGFCDTPKPPGWLAPVIESVEVTPEVVEAGSTFTVSVTASDDKLVTGMNVGLFEDPTDASTTALIVCDQPQFEPGWVSAPQVSVDITCSVDDAVRNGTWTATLWVFDGECSRFCSTDQDLSVEVVGGTDDQ